MKKRKFVSICLVLSLILSLTSVMGAEFTEEGTYDWLRSQTTDGSFNNDAAQTAWAALAFNKANLVTEATSSLDWLEANKNPSNCWPSASCMTQETALAALAFYESNRDTSDIEEYFRSSMQGYVGGGAWLLEITTPHTGTCTISYEVNNITEEIDIEVAEGTFPGCGNTNFLDLNTCLQSNLIKNNPNLDLNVDCSGLEEAPYTTLVYKTGNSFYLVSTDDQSIVDITVPNGCYGRGVGDVCNAEASLYAGWALNEMGSELDISVYLREVYDENNPLHNAILYFISKDTAYLAELDDLQSSDGSLSKNVLQTSLAVKAWSDDPATYATAIERATIYIKGRQRDDGSLNGQVIDTASAIYGAFGYGATSQATCTDGIMNGDERGVDCGGHCEEFDDCCANGVADVGEGDIDCGGVCEACVGEATCNGDGICDSELGETELNCADCQQANAACEENSVCEYANFGENTQNCPADCYCGDGVCDDTEDATSCSRDCETTPTTTEAEAECGDGFCEEDKGESADTCPEDCAAQEVTEEGGFSFVTLLIILLVLGALGGGGFFAYKKGWIKLPGKPKGPAPAGPPGYKPFTGRPAPQRPMPPRRPMGPPRRPMQRQGPGMGSSLAEARKLLKK